MLMSLIMLMIITMVVTGKAKTGEDTFILSKKTELLIYIILIPALGTGNLISVIRVIKKKSKTGMMVAILVEVGTTLSNWTEQLIGVDKTGRLCLHGAKVSMT